ncbi:LamB/YcsF family protein, partial [Alteromonas australica]
MKLNCDLGESFGAWTMPVDDEIMSIIDQANVACGFHAGDPLVMKQALTLAKQHGVEIGAHPSYPDLQGFGRRSLAMASDELVACVQYQV